MKEEQEMSEELKKFLEESKKREPIFCATPMVNKAKKASQESEN